MAGNKKLVKCTNAIKKDCKYGSTFNGCIRYCDYLCMTGERRGCSPDACDKFEKQTKPRPRRML